MKRWLKPSVWHLIYLAAMFLEIALAWRDVRAIERQESIRRRVMGG